MTRHHHIITATALWTCIGPLSCSLAGRAAEPEDVSYPPPPGAYRSEPPSVWSDTSYSPGPAQPAELDAPPAVPYTGSSSMLPLPDNSDDSPPGSYDANTLFGSRRPIERLPAALDQAIRQPESEQQSSVQSSPAHHPTAAPPTRNDLSMDLGRDTQRPAVGNGFQPPGGWAYQGYPAYAPTYPAYPQYPPPRQSGQGTGLVPAPPAQAYPGYQAGGYTPAYSRAGGGMPPRDYYPAGDTVAPEPTSDGYDTGSYPPLQGPSPTTMPYPATTDRTLFRPTE